jgi:hypothetical protein
MRKERALLRKRDQQGRSFEAKPRGLNRRKLSKFRERTYQTHSLGASLRKKRKLVDDNATEFLPLAAWDEIFIIIIIFHRLVVLDNGGGAAQFIFSISILWMHPLFTTLEWQWDEIRY